MSAGDAQAALKPSLRFDEAAVVTVRRLSVASNPPVLPVNLCYSDVRRREWHFAALSLTMFELSFRLFFALYTAVSNQCEHVYKRKVY